MDVLNVEVDWAILDSDSDDIYLWHPTEQEEIIEFQVGCSPVSSLISSDAFSTSLLPIEKIKKKRFRIYKKF
jgi:hypothetical protein